MQFRGKASGEVMQLTLQQGSNGGEGQQSGAAGSSAGHGVKIRRCSLCRGSPAHLLASRPSAFSVWMKSYCRPQKQPAPHCQASSSWVGRTARKAGSS